MPPAIARWTLALVAFALVPRARGQWVVPFADESLASRVCDPNCQTGSCTACIDTVDGETFNLCAAQPSNNKQLEVYLKGAELGHQNLGGKGCGWENDRSDCANFASKVCPPADKIANGETWTAKTTYWDPDAGDNGEFKDDGPVKTFAYQTEMTHFDGSKRDAIGAPMWEKRNCDDWLNSPWYQDNPGSSGNCWFSDTPLTAAQEPLLFDTSTAGANSPYGGMKPPMYPFDDREPDDVNTGDTTYDPMHQTSRRERATQTTAALRASRS